MNEHFEIQESSAGIEPVRQELAGQAPFPVWSGWDILLLFFFTGFTAIFVGVFGETVYHLLQVKFAWIWFLRHPAIEGILLLCFQAVLDVLMFMFIYFTVTLKYSSPFWSSIKWTPGRNNYLLTYLPVGVLLAFAVLGASALIPSSRKPPIEEVLKYPASALLFAGLGVIIAPFVEEVIFRGFIYPVVERKVGRILAVLATGFLFATVHVSQLWGSLTGIVLILLVGITLSAVRAKTDSLIPSFAIHLSYNSTICLIFLASRGFSTY